MTMNADRAIAFVCGIIGAYWAIAGWFSYGLWVNKGPGPGFLPVIFGSLTVILCIARLLRKDKEAEPVERKAIIPMAAMVASAVAIYVIGFLPAMFLLIIFWLVNQGAYSYKFSLFMATAIIVFIWGVFEYWLSVPFPTGLITF
jgi:hypothetical protein